MQDHAWRSDTESNQGEKGYLQNKDIQEEEEKGCRVDPSDPTDQELPQFKVPVQRFLVWKGVENIAVDAPDDLLDLDTGRLLVRVEIQTEFEFLFVEAVGEVLTLQR